MPKSKKPRRRGAEPVPAAKLKAFFASLAECGSVSAAANTAGMQRSTLYKLRDADDAFAARWDKAQKIGVDRVEDETVRRALDGVPKPVFYAGRQIASVQQYNDRLLQFLLKAHKPETYDRPRAPAAAPLPFDLVKRMKAAEARMSALGKPLPARRPGKSRGGRGGKR